MNRGQVVRMTHFTDVQGRMQLGWRAGGRKPNRKVYVALILGVEPHPDDLPDEGADFDSLYADGVLVDPNRALEDMGWKYDDN